jgi:hypothetical protein
VIYIYIYIYNKMAEYTRAVSLTSTHHTHVRGSIRRRETNDTNNPIIHHPPTTSNNKNNKKLTHHPPLPYPRAPPSQGEERSATKNPVGFYLRLEQGPRQVQFNPGGKFGFPLTAAPNYTTMPFGLGCTGG